MTVEAADELVRRLRRVGLSNAAIRAAWPRWWSNEADSSPSARLELRFSIARNLGLEPASLFEGVGDPRFVWRGEARFKRLTVASEVERDAIASFGKALGSVLVAATPETRPALVGASASELRRSILASGDIPFVRLTDLLALCWGIGIPIAHLQVFPGEQKGMAAMTVLIADRPVVLLAKASKFPGQLAFYVAHEIGHVAMSHVPTGAVLVDMDEDTPARDSQDQEELDADAYALELLTGEQQPKVVSGTEHASGPELARIALEGAAELGIEPGTLALCFGYSTGRWRTAMRAMSRIYPEAKPLWKDINRLALNQLSVDRLPEDSREYLVAALGLRDS